ncbi:conserved hypothetical protein [Bradyrhizobium oligotrophicum S58]|uniref:Lysozyme inhibitor LprI-like N-terminal domain-containing protein n=1 Tax=Bradyrhizobium oligotrophicum S58 TaxID=1245469 RepID=M4Z5T6_9BRAD|nr:lysozyme inhibitor LprI family protein [Bradyrhizobium oligotrophicum]BAM88472.1 conserved hypothetical protein [Bradyrhizobium oligotrophicum S58]
MRIVVYALVLASGLGLAPQALALDCGKAQQPVDKTICSTPALKKADDAMSAAYFKLLRETTDPDFHEALIRSQRRWLKVRSGGVDRFGAAESDPDAQQDDASVLLGFTRNRLAELQSGRLIRTMERQRAAAAKDSGGAFAGYDTACYVLPPPYGRWSFSCFSTAHRQQHDRICSVSTEWATGHMTEYRYLSVAKDGRPVLVAGCSAGESDVERCPEPDDDAEAKAIAHWNTAPSNASYVAPRPDQLWKYDPDVDPEPIAAPWMQDCLFAPAFPPPGQSRSAPAAKP